ncbi:hypothetical protein M2244_003778 [Rhodoferax antarcticus]|nr:hypothetical protein [Rhodoferax antarcticus]
MCSADRLTDCLMLSKRPVAAVPLLFTQSVIFSQ